MSLFLKENMMLKPEELQKLSESLMEKKMLDQEELQKLSEKLKEEKNKQTKYNINLLSTKFHLYEDVQNEIFMYLADEFETNASLKAKVKLYYETGKLDELKFLNTQCVTSMHRLFEDFINIVRLDIILSNWDTSNVVDMSYMLYGCKCFDGDLTDFPMPNVLDASYMFYGCERLNKKINFCIPKAINISYMFSDCSDLSKEVTLVVEDLKEAHLLFNNCYKFDYSMFNKGIRFI